MKKISLEKCRTFTTEGATKGATGLNGVAPDIKPNDNKGLCKKEVWLSISEGATLLNTTKRSAQRACRKNKYITKKVHGNGGEQYRILLSSLPIKAQNEYWNNRLQEEGVIETVAPEDDDDLEIARQEHSRSPQWRRDGFDKNLLTYNLTEHAKGKKEVESILKDWNNSGKSEMKVPESYQSVCRLRIIKSQYGYMGFFPAYGQNSTKTIVETEWLNFYESRFCTQQKRSIANCWKDTLMYFMGKDPSLKEEDFPSPVTFDKKLKSRYSPEDIYGRRHGEKARKQKFDSYIERDYSNTLPGECYVSDHAQLDVAVKLPTGKVCFPWVTAWVDFRTGKWLSWNLHAESPNSDHIFQTFYYAVDTWGIPKEVYIDNGKDYRCSDFTGGRKRTRKVSLSLDEGRAKTTLEILKIRVIFANPYGPQAKSIAERNGFLKTKERFSKFMIGYRGGSIQERPEELEKQIKQNKLMTIEEVTELFDRFIVNVLNKTPAQGKLLNGMCPDEMWEKDRITPRMAAKDSLRFACMRRTGPVSIGRNGVWDSKIGKSYWGEWMSGFKGRKVYIRRDPRKYQEAWVFSVEDADTLLGVAYIDQFKASAIARTDEEKAELEEVTAKKKRASRREKAYIEARDELLNQEKVELMEKYSVFANEKRGYIPSTDKPKVVEMVATPLDGVIRQVEIEEQERQERSEEKIIPLREPKVKKEIPIFWCDVLDRKEWRKKMGLPAEKAIGE